MPSKEIFRARLLLLGGCVVLYALASLSVAEPVPTVWSPYPASQFLPISIGLSRNVSLIGVALLFALWNAAAVTKPYRGRGLHLVVLAAPLTVATIAYFMFRLQDGLLHQGFAYSAGVITINVAMLTAFWCGWGAVRKRPSSPSAVLLGLLLFGWLASYAFPYFGQLI